MTDSLALFILTALGVAVALATKGKAGAWISTKSSWPSYAVYGLVLILALVFFCAILPPFRPYPYTDEWIYRLPFSFKSISEYIQWAFAQHVDHRIPIQKLLHFCILKAVGFDFRYLVGLNFLFAWLLCTILIRAAQMYRGYQSIGDLIIPLAGLSFGAGFTLWGFEFQFLSSSFFISSFLFLSICYDRGKKACQINAAVICLLLCSLCGINGMVMSSVVGALLVAYFVYEAFSVEANRPISTYFLLASCSVLNVILWRCWTPSGASDVQHFEPVEFAKFVYGLLPATFIVYSFDDTWWKFALVLALLLGAAWIVLSKIWRKEMTFAEFALASTLVATLLLLFSISFGRAKGQGGWAAVLAMHYGYLTIFLPLVSWILISSRLSLKWSNLLGILLVVVFVRAFQVNAVWRYGVIVSALPHQTEILQQLAISKDVTGLVSKYVLDFMWKDEPNLRQEVTDGITTFRRKGFRMYGLADQMSSLKNASIQKGSRDLTKEGTPGTVQLLAASQIPFLVDAAKPAAEGPWIEMFAIDGKPVDLHSASKAVEAKAGSRLEMAGWMADLANPTYKAPIFIALLSDDSWKSLKLLSCESVNRPDVAIYYKKQELAQCGFQFSGAVPEALAGNMWKVVLFSVGEKGPVRIDSGWRLSVVR